MKLNHAQRTHLVKKLSTEARSLVAKMKDPAGPVFEIIIPCKVEVGISLGVYGDCPTIYAVDPTQKQLDKLLTPNQKRALATAVAAKKAYNAQHAKIKSMVEDFKEQLLFADGGLDEANALIKTFLAKID